MALTSEWEFESEIQSEIRLTDWQADCADWRLCWLIVLIDGCAYWRLCWLTALLIDVRMCWLTVVLVDGFADWRLCWLTAVLNQSAGLLFMCLIGWQDCFSLMCWTGLQVCFWCADRFADLLWCADRFAGLLLMCWSVCRFAFDVLNWSIGLLLVCWIGWKVCFDECAESVDSVFNLHYNLESTWQ